MTQEQYFCLVSNYNSVALALRIVRNAADNLGNDQWNKAHTKIAVCLQELATEMFRETQKPWQ